MTESSKVFLSRAPTLRRMSTVRRTPEAVERALSDGALTNRHSGFDIEEEIGRGAMGCVRRAHDRLLGRNVAVKVLEDGESGFVRRFVVEAQLGAQLEHPNIVPFYELFATSEGRPAFAMKLVDGETFEAYLSECASSPERAREPPYDLMSRLDRFLKICDGIDYAHARGVVHRDLKPSNVMLGPHNEVYVMDWGIARVLGDAGEPEKEAARRHREAGLQLTADGEIIGTPQYMAPEQARGEPVTTAADQFALGMILAELATLSAPREGSAHQVLGDAMLGRPPRLAPRSGEPVPRELVAIIRKATAALPVQRYASVTELAADVRRFMRDEPISVLRDPPWMRAWRPLKRRPLVILAVVAACLLSSSVLAVVGLVRELRAREHAALHTERIFNLTAAVARTARSVDAHFQRVELLVEGLAFGAAEAIHAPPLGGLTPLTPAEVEAREAPVFSPRYGQRVSFARSAYVRSPNVDPASIQPVLARLAALEGLLVGAAARGAVGALAEQYPGEQQRAVAREHGNIAWTDLAFESGVLLVYPGNTHFPPDFDVRQRSWYTAARAQPGRVWGSPYPDATSGALLIACSRAFGSPGAAPVGVAAAHIRLEDVLGALSVSGVEGYESSALLDGEGNVVLSEDTRAVKLGAGTHHNRALARPPFEVAAVREAVAAGTREGRIWSQSTLTVFQRLETQDWYLAVTVASELYGWD